MSALQTTDGLFFDKSDLAPEDAARLVSAGLQGAHGGELFLEKSISESITWQSGRIVDLSRRSNEGFGFRYVSDDKVGYAFASPVDDRPALTQDALKSAIGTAGQIRTYCTEDGHVDLTQTSLSRSNLYASDSPIDAVSLQDKIRFLQEVDAFARTKDNKLKDVGITLVTDWQAVQIIKADGQRVADIRPLVQFRVTTMLEHQGRRENGTAAIGGRRPLDTIMAGDAWKDVVIEALRVGNVNLEAEEAPKGPTTVVLGNGWPGVMLHEAVGHGLEGDFNRKGVSAFSGKVGEKVAAECVTVVDRGDLPGRRGSIEIDDEGNPGRRNVLIQNGILRGYMQDEMNGRLMGGSSTGSGRRESYKFAPMPRMTTTFMTSGQYDPAEILASVKDGVYAANFSGGTVDIVSGDFNFAAVEAYRIRNGQIAEPLSNVMLVGNGPKSMNKITMLGTDINEDTGVGLDPGIGLCGKRGQWLPVGLGQPTVRMDETTLG